MPLAKQDNDFKNLIRDEIVEVSVPATALDQAIGWIRDRLEPDDVFEVSELEDWARTNGWVKED